MGESALSHSFEYLHLNIIHYSKCSLFISTNLCNKCLKAIAVCCFWFGKLQSAIEATRLEAISYYTSIYLFPLNWMRYYLFSGDSHVETFQWNGIKLLKIVVPRSTVESLRWSPWDWEEFVPSHPRETDIRNMCLISIFILYSFHSQHWTLKQHQQQKNSNVYKYSEMILCFFFMYKNE